MHKFPHRYRVSAAAGPAGDVELAAEGVESILSQPPVEFDGPGDRWSPESLLVSAVADCFVLTFRAIARASKLEWNSLRCEVEGVLEHSAGKTRFTQFDLSVTLDAPDTTNKERAHRLLEKAEESCLITNSLSASVNLDAQVQ